MRKLMRQIIFVTFATILRWPVCALIALVGRTGVFKTVFLVYATDENEVQGVYPKSKFIRRYLSGKPTPAGLIMDGWLPIGLYLGIPDLPRDLSRKKNRHIAEKIIQQMHWYRRLAGARTIGLAGQLGPIFSRRHNIPMDPPIFTSFYGNIFSVHEAINWVSRQKRTYLHRQKITIIGGGELGTALQTYLNSQGYDCSMISVRYTVRGKVRPVNVDESRAHLHGMDFVINLMPRGEEFMESGLGEVIPQNTAIVDFSRPPIPAEQLTQKVYMGNRVRRSGMRFMFALPGGGWKQKQLPACSLPALIAAMTGQASSELESFCLLARQQFFSTALIDTQVASQTAKLPRWDAIWGRSESGVEENSALDSVELFSQK